MKRNPPPPAPREANEATPIKVESLYGHKSQRGLVALTVGDQQTIMSATKAREIGMFLLTAAEAAETDEGLVRFCESMEFDQRETLAMLRSLRNEREIARQHNLTIEAGDPRQKAED